MALKCQKELFATIMAELPPLFVVHDELFTEDRSTPLDPDWLRYAGMEKQKQLHIVTARDDGILVGYYFAVIMPSLHRKHTKCAFSDMFFMLPDYANGWNILRLIKATERMLRKQGVVKSYLVTKQLHPITILLKRLNYVFTELVHVKTL